MPFLAKYLAEIGNKNKHFVAEKLFLKIRTWDCLNCKTTDIKHDINTDQNIMLVVKIASGQVDRPVV
jgi:hypothetical protein